MARTFKDLPPRIQMDRLEHKTAHHWACENTARGGRWLYSSHLELDDQPSWLDVGNGEKLRRVDCCWTDVWATNVARDRHRQVEHDIQPPLRRSYILEPDVEYRTVAFGRRLWLAEDARWDTHDCDLDDPNSHQCTWWADDPTAIKYASCRRPGAAPRERHLSWYGPERAAVRDALIDARKEWAATGDTIVEPPTVDPRHNRWGGGWWD